MNNDISDFLIIGAGIIGLTLARAIKKHYPNATITILEKEKTIGKHASGRNSGVIHSGIYYPANTLKAKFCNEGAHLLISYAEENNIPIKKDGKIIIATSEEDIPSLNKLFANATAHQINAEKITKDEIGEIEPYACSDFGGIYCKDTAVINSQQVLESLTKELLHHNVKIEYDQKIIKIDEKQKKVYTQNTTYCFGKLINTAGAYADSIAKMVNVGNEYTLIPFKGTYYKLKPTVNHTVRASIYPVPNPNLPFLGVHLTRVITGDVYVGPTVIPTLGRENYNGFQGLNLPEGINITQQLMKLYYKNTQNFRSLVKVAAAQLTQSGVVHSARRLVNTLESSWVEKSPKVGIRPQLLNTKTMQLEMDFLIKNGKHSLHVLNSISPAFTSSFAVANHLVTQINQQSH